MKANNGVLLLDDFGRQRMRPQELLNRWMTPLDRGIDFLTSSGGKKFELPFDLFVVFSTNLDPLELADDAFLRRIRTRFIWTTRGETSFWRFSVPNANCACCRSIPVAAEYLADYIADEMQQPYWQCYARDLINQIAWTANYQGLEPQLTREVLEQACRAVLFCRRPWTVSGCSQRELPSNRQSDHAKSWWPQIKRRRVARNDEADNFIYGAVFQLDALVVNINAYGVALTPWCRCF